ncbi:MAG: diadenylate cyclase CdaA [Lachnospiraceae bacterium]|nr:diadenylate cyclase CdaA [Lachnospiraceae bacterium]
MESVTSFFKRIQQLFEIPRFTFIDFVEVLIIAFLVYQIVRFVRSTRAWNLFKGIAVVLVFALFAAIFRMNTILWLLAKGFNVGIIALVIVFQPELRNVLERLGRKNFLAILTNIDWQRGTTKRFSDKTINELVRAVFDMAEDKTGALIVVERDTQLVEYTRTGIDMDSLISSQLLLNIFEHNTPLHDGAIVVRGDRIVSATCYLPLSDNLSINKDLGTRHRAALGVSEVSDALTIVVSEETGVVSVAENGRLSRELTPESLKELLKGMQNKGTEDDKMSIFKGRRKSVEEKN